MVKMILENIDNMKNWLLSTAKNFCIIKPFKVKPLPVIVFGPEFPTIYNLDRRSFDTAEMYERLTKIPESLFKGIRLED
jgi:hypothetical protein